MRLPTSQSPTWVRAVSDLEFQKILVVSSGHITQEDMWNLEKLAETFRDAKEDEKGFEVLDCSTGMLLYVYSGASGEAVAAEGWMLTTFPEWKDMGVQLKALYRLAARAECTYLKLDRDGPEIAGLELFDW